MDNFQQKTDKSRMCRIVDWALSFMFITILGWVVFMKVTPEAAFVLMVIGACAGLMWLLRQRKSRMLYGEVGQHWQKLYVPICIMLVVILVLIMLFPLRAKIIAYVTPEGNIYTHAYSYATGDVALPYGLFVEYGVRDHATDNVDVETRLTNSWVAREYWWDIPSQLRASPKAIALGDRPGDYSQGLSTIVGRGHTPPNFWESPPSDSYVVRFSYPVINHQYSLYLRFTSDKPLMLSEAKFAGKSILIDKR